MNSGGLAKIKAGFIGTVISGLYKLSRDHEKTLLREKTRQEMAQHTSQAEQKPKTAKDSLELQKEVEEHIIERDLPILRAECSLKKT